MSLLQLFIGSLIVIIRCLNAHAQDQTPVQLLENVQTSLVEVRASNTKNFSDNNGHQRSATYQSLGSGVIIDSHGLIVTNTHIVANAPQILVGHRATGLVDEGEMPTQLRRRGRRLGGLGSRDQDPDAARD